MKPAFMQLHAVCCCSEVFTLVGIRIYFKSKSLNVFFVWSKSFYKRILYLSDLDKIRYLYQNGVHIILRWIIILFNVENLETLESCVLSVLNKCRIEEDIYFGAHLITPYNNHLTRDSPQYNTQWCARIIIQFHSQLSNFCTTLCITKIWNLVSVVHLQTPVHNQIIFSRIFWSVEF